MIINDKLFVDAILYYAVLMRLLMRLFIPRGSLMLFLLVREILSFYSLKHSLMILSLTFISSKHGSRNYNLLVYSKDVAIIDLYYSESSVHSPFLSYMHAHVFFLMSSILLIIIIIISFK